MRNACVSQFYKTISIYSKLQLSKGGFEFNDWELYTTTKEADHQVAIVQEITTERSTTSEPQEKITSTLTSLMTTVAAAADAQIQVTQTTLPDAIEATLVSETEIPQKEATLEVTEEFKSEPNRMEHSKILNVLTSPPNTTSNVSDTPITGKSISNASSGKLIFHSIIMVLAAFILVF
jgi:hypothetical protein